jgi:GNAT superfamily N-acetyltransferase
MLIDMSEQRRILIRERREPDGPWVAARLCESWGSTTVISRGEAHDAARLPAFIAVQGDDLVGLATFRFADGDCELVTLDALHKARGIGSALFASVVQEATNRACRRLWLITTNDNLDAARFYQRRGMRLTAVHRSAVDDARRMKPSIPETGDYGIPLHDELEFELLLS